MRKAALTAFIALSIILTMIPAADVMQKEAASDEREAVLDDLNAKVASEGGAGNPIQSVLYLSRVINGQSVLLLNSFVDLTTRTELIDLSSYQEPGWTLFQATVTANNITAAPERKSVGNYSLATYSNFYRIWEYDLDLYYDHLAQGFYNMTHDGQLQNFSILYDSPSFTPGPLDQGYAYLEIRGNYSDESTTLAAGVEIQDVGTSATWMSVSQSAILSANKVYYAVINGSLLQEAGGEYPNIRWYCESDDGEFTTWRHTTSGAWEERPFEALVNYTYTPWNQTSNSALEYLDYSEIDLKLNGTHASGLSSTLSLNGNITSIQFDSNQSVSIHYNLTLWYRQDATSTTNWEVQTSGSPVYWNATTVTSYPAMTGIHDRHLNVSVPLDWTTTGLYNSSSAVNHTDYIRLARNVTCSSMTSETWTLTFEGHNYVTDIRTFDAFDDSELFTKANITVNMDINSTIEDQAAIGVDTGTTNLTVVHEGSTVYAPLLGGVSGGNSHYLWDVSTASDNGTFLIQVYWSNGTEAGLLTKQMTVFYPTSLTSITAATIYANTDSSFTVTVQFDDEFNSVGISSPDAVLTYDYRSIVNDTMNDLGGGTWTVDVDTLNNASGTDTLTVYAVGPAIQNRSIDITITLTHQTSLQLEWISDTFDWTQYSIFRVNYTHDRDGSLITDADQLDISVDGSPTLLHGTNGTYWIEFNNTFDLGFHSVLVNISKAGYDHATDTASFTINETVTSISVIWEPANVTIDYDHALNLTVDYEYSGGDVPASATVNVTMGGSTYNLTFSGSVWVTSIPGWNLGPGLHNADIVAWLHGYEARFNTTLNINVTVSASQLVVKRSWDVNSVLYDEIRILRVNVTYANGTFTDDASVSALVNGTLYPATSFANGTYEIAIGPVMMLGVHEVNLTVVRSGYETSSLSLTLDVTSIPSTVSVSATFSMYWDDSLTLDVTLRDGRDSTPILIDDIVCGWTVAGWSWTPIGPGLSRATILSTGLDISNYTLTLTVQKLGYQDNVTQWEIQVLPVSLSLQFLDVFEEYENETVWISATIQDDFHVSGVDWGDVTLQFDGTNYSMPYNAITSAYRYGLWLSSSYPPGNYTFEIIASAQNCDSTRKMGNLTVLAKVHTLLMLVELDANIIGNVIPVTVNASRSGVPVAGLTITVFARFNVSDGQTTLVFKWDETDLNGIAEVNIDVPASATGAIVWAEFAGSRQEWPASSTPVLVTVTPQNILGILLFLIQQPLVLFLLTVVVVVVGTRSLWKGKLQPRRFAAKTALEKQLEAFMELEMVQHFMAVYTDRGTCVFYHPFAQSRIQPDLISGFIAAITSVYGEIKGDGVQGSLEEINYQGLRLNSYSGRYIIGIMIVEGEMSSRLRDRLRFFVEIFEDQYETDLEGWTGLVDCFDPEWVVSNLNTAFNYDWMLPHYVDPKVKLKGPERKVVDLIKELYGRGEFLVRDILTKAANKLKTTEAETFDIILRLMDRGAIYPISIHTVLQRQGLGIADEEEESIYEVSTTPEIDEPRPVEEVAEPEPVEEVVEPEPVEEVAELEPVEEVIKPEKEEEPPAEVEEELTEEEKFLREVEDLISKEKGDSD